ncbi:MAG: hypothetical protein RLY97_1904, partial [Pseudomonadota bacterium]
SWALIADMGWLMMPLAEDAGGLGLTGDAIAAVHFELGKVLSTAPLTSALLGITAIGMAADLPNHADWIEKTTSGQFITASLALTSPNLTTDGDKPSLNGTLNAVADADMASHILILTAGLGIACLLPRDAAGVTITERQLWDESRRLFDVTLENVVVEPALVLASGEAVKPLARALKGQMLIALAADALGGANAALDRSVDYLKTRRQFDRPLAMFQALKHRCANLKAQITAAEALLWSRAADPSATTAQLGALKALACDVYRATVEEAIQLHGGIGLTEEHPCHLYMKRAMLGAQLGGSSDFWFEAAGRAALT